MPGYDKSRTPTNISNAVLNTTTDAEPAPKLEKTTMEAVREMDVVDTDEREKATATTGTEATTETVGIQAMKKETPEEDSNSNHGGAISPTDNSYTPKT